MVVVRQFPCMGTIDSRSLLIDIYARMMKFDRRFTFAALRRVLGNVHTCVGSSLHGTSGFHSHYGLLEGNNDQCCAEQCSVPVSSD
jgi:hypothetical protein